MPDDDETKTVNLDDEGNPVFDESNPDTFEEQDNELEKRIAKTEAESTPEITRKEAVQNIFIKFTDQELIEKGKTLASEYQEMNVLETQKKESADKFNERIKGCSGTIREIAGELSDGGEYQMTEVEITYDWEKNTKTIVTKDDYLVSESPIPDDERQRELFATEKLEDKLRDVHETDQLKNDVKGYLEETKEINNKTDLLMNGEDESEDPENRK